MDLKRYLTTVKNGETLLSAVQQKGSAKQKCSAVVNIIAEVEEQFEQFKATYSDVEEIQYEHDHTTILKQVCEKNKINDVTEVVRPSGTIWKLSTHLPSFRVLEHVEQKKETLTLFKTGMNALSLKAEKTSNFFRFLDQLTKVFLLIAKRLLQSVRLRRLLKYLIMMEQSVPVIPLSNLMENLVFFLPLPKTFCMLVVCRLLIN